MARKPSPPSYANMTLTPVVAELKDPPAQHWQADTVTAPMLRANTSPHASLRRRTTLKAASHHLMVYVHPDAGKALKRYALDRNTKVHSLVIEALEEWFRRNGLREPVRADTGQTE